ncbi:unnamed protein product [Durusdinium trenchii]|uniref:Uncharacterized protein n=2 Tax=Durusdinium trenchii TaxID=1381693 RepID=A0ABP0NJT6_9DINO
MLNVGPPAQASSGQFPPTAVGLGPRSRALRAPKPRNEALMVRLHRLLALPTVVSASKFFSLRGAQEHLLFASIGKQRTPIKVAIVCAIVTTIITYLLYKVYVDSMLRRRSEHQEEEEVTKPKAVPKSPKRERSSKALAAKPDESKLCCYDGLMRFASSRGTVEAKASRPNFSGTWSCVKAEGDLDGLYAAMGLGYFARCALERAQWGAGHLSRTYEHQGDHVKLVQKATEETTQEFDINGTPQKVSQGDGVVIQTTSWDDEEEGVLLFETKDLLGCDPNSWTHCRQYLQGEELVIEVRGARGHRAVWTYHRALS